MAIAIAITSDEARAAVDDALATDGPPRVVIATRRNGVFAKIGVVAELDGQPAMLPGGVYGATIRALHRAELGRARRVGGALRIEVTDTPTRPRSASDAHELAREYRAVVEAILEARGDPRVAAFLRAIDRPRRARRHRRLLARPLASSARSSCSRRSTSRRASSSAVAWAREDARPSSS